MLNSKLDCNCLALTEAQYPKGDLRFRVTECSEVFYTKPRTCLPIPAHGMPSYRIFQWLCWPQQVTEQRRNGGCWYDKRQEGAFPQVTRASICTALALAGPYSVKNLQSSESVLLCFVVIVMSIYLHGGWWLYHFWAVYFFPACSGSRIIFMCHLSTTNASLVREYTVHGCLQKDECHPGACTSNMWILNT